MTERDRGFSQSVYFKYNGMCGGFPAGRCKDIAKEIQKYVGGKIIAGLVGSGVQHFWVKKDEEIIDPMYENEIHQECYIFKAEKEND